MSKLESPVELGDAVHVRRMHEVPEKVKIIVFLGRDARGTATTPELQQSPRCHAPSAPRLPLRELTHAVHVVTWHDDVTGDVTEVQVMVGRGGDVAAQQGHRRQLAVCAQRTTTGSKHSRSRLKHHGRYIKSKKR